MKDSYIAAMDGVRMPENCRRKIEAALAERETAGHRKGVRMRTGVVMAAVMCLLIGSALAVTYRTGVLEAFFTGDTSVLEPYVQTNVSSVSDGNYLLTVDSYLFDGAGAYIVLTVKGLNDTAVEDLKSNRVIAQTHLDFWGQDMVDYLMERGRSGPDSFHVSEMWGQSVEELTAPDETSRSWRIKADTPGEGLSGQPLELWVDFMGRDYAVLLPIDTAAPAVTLFPDIELTTLGGDTAILQELTLKSTGVSYVVNYPEEVEDPFHGFEFQLRLKDGTVLNREELETRFNSGATTDDLGHQYQNNEFFASPVDLAQVEAVIVNGTELLIVQE